MRKQFEFSEEDLYLAAREAEQFIRAQYPDAQTCPPHTFSPAFEADMQQLFAQLQNGTLKTSAARLGWPYYLRRSIAAILLCFLLACATMPEAVMAGYQKLIEVVEHVFEEYTKIEFANHTMSKERFIPITLSYLPEGFQKVKCEKVGDSIDLVYEGDGKYFTIFQKLIVENNHTTYYLDTANTRSEYCSIGEEQVELKIKGDEIYFIWLHENYRIIGQTNLPQEEIIKILNSVKFH